MGFDPRPPGRGSDNCTVPHLFSALEYGAIAALLWWFAYPFATIRCKPRQTRKRATVVVELCADCWWVNCPH